MERAGLGWSVHGDGAAGGSDGSSPCAAGLCGTLGGVVGACEVSVSRVEEQMHRSDADVLQQLDR